MSTEDRARENNRRSLIIDSQLNAAKSKAERIAELKAIAGGVQAERDGRAPASNDSQGDISDEAKARRIAELKEIASKAVMR